MSRGPEDPCVQGELKSRFRCWTQPDLAPSQSGFNWVFPKTGKFPVYILQTVISLNKGGSQKEGPPNLWTPPTQLYSVK